MNSILYTLISVLFGSSVAIGQSLTNDLSFNKRDSVSFKSGTDGRVIDFCILSDDRMIISGEFTHYNGIYIQGIARILSNGELDPTFSPGSGVGFLPSGTIVSTAEQTDGKILIAGSFTTYNGSPVNRIARLNIDGSLDNSFNIGSGANNYINKIVLQPDGKILIAGAFSQFGSTSTDALVRLNSDGTVDNSFSTGSGLPTSIYTELTDIAVQSDGKILLAAGMPTTFNGTNVGGIFRLNSNGSLDNSFDIGSGADSQIRNICIQQDGDILVAGLFSTFDGLNHNGIARINIDGSVDNSFNAVAGGPIAKMAQKSTGEIAIVGDFALFNNANRRGIAYLNLDGTLNSGYFACYDFTYYPQNVGFQSNGKMVIAGPFSGMDFLSDVGTFATGSLARFKEDGFLDPEFNTATGFDGIVQSLKIQSDGKVLVGGSFYKYNQKSCNRIACLNPDGTMDSIFNANIGSGPNHFFCSTMSSYGAPTVSDILMYPDGRKLLIGTFTEFNGYYAKGIYRINADGTTDQSEFFLSDLNDWSMNKGVLQPDGKILVLSNASWLYRLNSNGTVDNTFASGISGVSSFALQPDGKIIIAHGYPTVIKRLNPNGSFDNTFTNGSIPNNCFSGTQTSLVTSVLIQPDGKIIVSGRFDNYNGVPCPSIVRLNTDGSLDANPFVFSGFNADYIFSTLLSDNKLACMGQLTNIGTGPFGGFNIMRFNTDGTFYDSTDFNMSDLLSLTYGVCAEQNDGKLVVGGNLTNFNSIVRNGLLRLVDCQPIYATENVTEQFTYTWPVNGMTYTTSGQHIETIPNSEGCDSIVTLNLTITQMSVTCYASPSYVDSCNGVVNLSASGIPNFIFDVGNGFTITSSGYAVFDSLCPGIYSVQVTDGNGDTLNSTFVIPSDSTYILVDPFGGAGTDSTVILIENCDLDYPSIDSVYIDSYTILAADSVLLNWAVIDINGTTIIPSILVLVPGNIYTQLQLYCSTKSANEYFVATIGINYDGNRISTLGLKPVEMDVFNIYPNPASNQIHINFSGPEAELMVYDLQGKIVLNDLIRNKAVVSLDNFEKGVYLFDFKTAQGHSVQRVVKQ